MSNINLPAEILDELTPEDMTEIMDLADVIHREHSTEEDAARALLIYAQERVFINRATRNVPLPRNITEISDWYAEFDGTVARIVTILTTAKKNDLWAAYQGIQYAPSGEIRDLTFTVEYAETSDPADLERFASELTGLARRARGWKPE